MIGLPLTDPIATNAVLGDWNMPSGSSIALRVQHSTALTAPAGSDAVNSSALPRFEVAQRVVAGEAFITQGRQAPRMPEAMDALVRESTQPHTDVSD